MRMSMIVSTLRHEKASLEAEMGRMDAALAALGEKTQKRVLSKDARERIAAAQRLRWKRTKRANRRMASVAKISDGWTPTQARRMKKLQAKKAA